MSERLDEEWRTEKVPWSSKPQNEKVRSPTGHLRVYVGSGTYSEVEIGDDSEHPLERTLNGVFERVYRAVVRSWVRKREWADRERRLAEEKGHQEEAKRRDDERKRREALVS